MKKIIRECISWFSYYGLTCCVYLIKVSPKKTVDWLGSVLSSLYYWCAVRNRKLALRNLRLALGPEIGDKRVKEIAKASFKTMGNVVLDTIKFKDLKPEQIRKLIDIEGSNHLDDALKKGKGVIVVSAHLGSFSLVGTRLNIDGHKANIVARHMRYKRLEKLFLKFCRQVGQRIIFNSPIVAFYRRCMRILSRNEIIIFELDQNFGTYGEPVVFFGRKAMVANGPIAISMRTQAVILPMFIVRNPNNTHVLKIEPPVELTSSGDKKKDMSDNLQRTINVIEKYIIKYPGQWVNWIHKRWDG